MKRTMLGMDAALLLAAPVAAQEAWSCDQDRDWGGDRERACEVREVRMAALDAIAVDGGQNGGVRVIGWDRNEILVQAKVTAWADRRADAQALVDDVEIRTGRTIEADGPRMRDHGWGVSYRIYVPRDTDLALETHNGGIGIEGVESRITFEAQNGGVRLTHVGGDVSGHTTNGGLTIVLDGRAWRGGGLDAKTTNGGVRMTIPADYSATLVTGTTNGGMEIDFPITVQGKIGRRLETTLGGGGALIRAITTNGGVKITRG